MGGYKKHTPTIYVVSWDGDVIKVGYTEKQRWRKFALLGATVLELFEFEDHVSAFKLESAGLKWLSQECEPAFENIAESVFHLGPDGGGYRECYRVPPGFKVADLLGHMHEVAGGLR